MNCDKCNQPIPTDTPYRSSSAVDEEIVPAKSNPLSHKARLVLWTLGSGLGRTVLGLTFFALILGGLWCLFPGLTRLGFFANDHLWHFTFAHSGGPCVGCCVDGWLVGWMTMLIAAVGIACIWFSRRIGDRIIRFVSRKG